MFIDLIKIVNFIRSSFKDIGSLGEKNERKKAILEILKTYFLLLDVANDGELLLKKAGSNPVRLIEDLPPEQAIKRVDDWDLILRKQGVRLNIAQSYISSQSCLAVFSPKTVEKIGKVIGYKMDRLVNLHAIGATLFFRNMFPSEETEKTKAELVTLVLSKQESGQIDVSKIQSEIDELKLALAGYRTFLEQAVTSTEIVALSDQARNETKM